MKTGRRPGELSGIVSACRSAVRLPEAWVSCSIDSKVWRGVVVVHWWWCDACRPKDRMGVVGFDLVISFVVGLGSIARRGSVGLVGSNDGGGLGRLLHGVSVRLHSNACLEANPVR